jgi:hypothetical protein
MAPAQARSLEMVGCRARHERAFERCVKELRTLRNESRNRKLGSMNRKGGKPSKRPREAEETGHQAAETRKQELHTWAVLLAEVKVDHQQILTLGARLPLTMAAIKEEDRKRPQTAG